MALGTLIVLQLIAADVPPPPPPPDQPVVAHEHGPDWHFGLAFAGGGEQLDEHTWAQIGITVGVARRVVDDLSIAIRGEMMTTNRDLGDAAGTVILGESLRGLVGLEYRALHKGLSDEPTSGGLDLVVAGGVGRELSAWDDGVVDRGLGYVAVEGHFSFGLPKTAPFKGISAIGFILGVRAQLAAAYEPEVLARACSHCGGMPLPDSGRTDLAIMGYYGLEFGR